MGHLFSSIKKREVSPKKILGTVLKDKEKIKQMIEELDQYKHDALKTTWVSRFQGTVAQSERLCYLFRTSTKRFHKIEERVHKARGVYYPGLETKLRLRS
jgi:hypothetical protein